MSNQAVSVTIVRPYGSTMFGDGQLVITAVAMRCDDSRDAALQTFRCRKVGNLMLQEQCCLVRLRHSFERRASVKHRTHQSRAFCSLHVHAS